MLTLLLEYNSLPRLKNLALEDKKEDFSALKGRLVTEFKSYISKLTVVSMNNNAVDVLQLVLH